MRLATLFLSVVLGMTALTSVPFAQEVHAQEAVKLAYVDLQRALNSVEEGRTAKSRLEKDFESRQKELNKAQEDLKAWIAEVEASVQMLTEEARMAKMKEYQQRMGALQEKFQGHQRELAQAEAQATRGIFEKMLALIAEISKERGYTMVFEKTESSVLWAAPGLDFTDELIKRYDAKY